MPGVTAKPALTIRMARPDDVPTILRLIRGLAEYERLAHLVPVEEASLREHLFGRRPYCEVLIGELDGRPAGFALFFHNYSTFLGKPGIYLEDLFVLPEDRGRGLGTALLRTIGRLAVERGCGRVEWAVLDWNEPSIRFYESLGARAMDEWTIYRVAGDGIEALASGSAEIAVD